MKLRSVLKKVNLIDAYSLLPLFFFTSTLFFLKTLLSYTRNLRCLLDHYRVTERTAECF
jgi:hypothetical protein